MSKTYRAGLVGCGGMGRHHLQVLNDLPEFELVALCDIFPDAVNKSGDEYGVEARYLDFDQMYDEANLDLVTIATQTRGHHAPCVRNLSPLTSSKRMTWSLLGKPPVLSSPSINRTMSTPASGKHKRW
ncbi:Gfo/Idh/MocA family oxidoreductase [Candidatus Poribacteria bacterium]|nr:Gfo/Idh/MocA family oxidoreductase [Candidatus Poribacteria bacterium]